MSKEITCPQKSDADEKDLLICQGLNSGKICLRITPDRLFVVLEGEPSGKVLTDCFREALALGQCKIDVPAVVDLTQYRGDVDWTALRAIRDMAPWKTPMTAYVVRPHAMFDMVIKIVGTIFTNVQHRIFNNREDALSWLDSVQAAGH